MIDAQQNLKIKIDNWPKMGLTTAPSPLPSQPSVGLYHWQPKRQWRGWRRWLQDFSFENLWWIVPPWALSLLPLHQLLLSGGNVRKDRPHGGNQNSKLRGIRQVGSGNWLPPARCPAGWLRRSPDRPLRWWFTDIGEGESIASIEVSHPRQRMLDKHCLCCVFFKKLSRYLWVFPCDHFPPCYHLLPDRCC